jgi:hypothetical protein
VRRAGRRRNGERGRRAQWRGGAGGRCAAGLGTVALAALLGGCGGGIATPDLFVVQRTGSVSGANLTLLIGEAGAVHCNGRQAPGLSDPQVVTARGIQEDLKEQAAQHLSLPARPGSVLGYYLRDEYGTVRFADNSANRPKPLDELQKLVLEVARANCHLPL